MVGSETGEFLSADIPFGGATVHPYFPVSWAIRVGAGPGAIAIHIHDKYESLSEGPEPNGPVSRSVDHASMRWAETIYQSNVRKPDLECSYGCSPARVAEAWYEIAKKARSLKRGLRR